MLKVNIYLQLCFTKVLNEFKFKYTRNTNKVKDKENSCIRLLGSLQLKSNIVSYFNINRSVLEFYFATFMLINYCQKMTDKSYSLYCAT